MSSKFRYKPLQEGTIRLVRILSTSDEDEDEVRCALIEPVAFETDHVEYTALSYCWGSEGGSKKIILDGCEFPITENLWSALSSIRRQHRGLVRMPHGRSYELFWIDAICLDQSNIEERNHQVGHMWKIYSEASMTFAWLGVEDQLTTAFDALSKTAASCESKSWPFCSGLKSEHADLNAIESEAIMALACNDYFKRTWILLEFVQASTLYLLCGNVSCSSTILYHVRRRGACERIGKLLDGRRTHAEGGFFLAGTRLQHRMRLEDALARFKSSHCRDKRDRIFAMLNDPAVRLLRPPFDLVPDYSLTIPELIFEIISTEELSDTMTGDPGNNSEILNLVAEALLMDTNQEVIWPIGAVFDYCRENLNWRNADDGTVTVTLNSGRKVQNQVAQHFLRKYNMALRIASQGSDSDEYSIRRRRHPKSQHESRIR